MGNRLESFRRLLPHPDQFRRRAELKAAQDFNQRCRELLQDPSFDGASFNQVVDLIIDRVGEDPRPRGDDEITVSRASKAIVDPTNGIAYMLYRYRETAENDRAGDAKPKDFASIEILPSWTVDKSARRESEPPVVETLIYGNVTDKKDANGQAIPQIGFSLLMIGKDSQKRRIFHSHLTGELVLETLKTNQISATSQNPPLELVKKVCTGILETVGGKGVIIPQSEFPDLTPKAIISNPNMRTTLEITIANNSR